MLYTFYVFSGWKISESRIPRYEEKLWGQKRTVDLFVGGKQTERKTPMKTKLTAFSIFQSLIEAHTHTHE